MQGCWQRAYRGASRGHTGMLVEGMQGHWQRAHRGVAMGMQRCWQRDRSRSCIPCTMTFSRKKDLLNLCSEVLALSCAFPEGQPFLFPKRSSMVTVDKVPFLRVSAIILQDCCDKPLLTAEVYFLLFQNPEVPHQSVGRNMLPLVALGDFIHFSLPSGGRRPSGHPQHVTASPIPDLSSHDLSSFSHF